MGTPKKQPPVKLISGFIFSSPDNYLRSKIILKKRFGKIDFESPVLPFTATSYYEAEFGKNLKRAFVSFEKLTPADNLEKIKLFTNLLEKKFSLKDKRTINIDPGYVDLAKLVLATTKDFKHRIYLGQGVFAEITLFYQNNSFRAWEWTYPDYQTPAYISIFNQIRDIYARQSK